jgi:hypothetical protein
LDGQTRGDRLGEPDPNTSWRRWTLLAMLAHALLAVFAATEHIHAPAPADLTALTCNEIRRLFTIYVIEPHRARTSHYQRQGTAQTGT